MRTGMIQRPRVEGYQFARALPMDETSSTVAVIIKR